MKLISKISSIIKSPPNWRKGSLVVCIDNFASEISLTYDKKYIVLNYMERENSPIILIKNDEDEIHWYEAYLFEDISKLRKEKLKKINNNKIK
jgi:hypothetical protein